MPCSYFSLELDRFKFESLPDFAANNVQPFALAWLALKSGSDVGGYSILVALVGVNLQ